MSERDLTDNIRNMHSLKTASGISADRLGFSLFQVDDGYQRAWGDWLLLDQERFPSQSMGSIVAQVRRVWTRQCAQRLTEWHFRCACPRRWRARR